MLSTRHQSASPVSPGSHTWSFLSAWTTGSCRTGTSRVIQADTMCLPWWTAPPATTATARTASRWILGHPGSPTSCRAFARRGLHLRRLHVNKTRPSRTSYRLHRTSHCLRQIRHSDVYHSHGYYNQTDYGQTDPGQNLVEHILHRSLLIWTESWALAIAMFILPPCTDDSLLDKPTSTCSCFERCDHVLNATEGCVSGVEYQFGLSRLVSSLRAIDSLCLHNLLASD
jgi:hypothetical protein